MKRHRVHATIELILRDQSIERDEKILRKLKATVRSGTPSRAASLKGSASPALYRRFRGTGFPLKNTNNRKLPAWRSLSHWMRAQLIAMSIGQYEHRQFRVRLNDELRLREEAKGNDLKVYLRDRLTRVLSESFEHDPWYLFVIEDLDTDGKTLVRPHAHGIIRIRPVAIEKIKNKRSRIAYERSAASIGREAVELRAGEVLTRELLNRATGNGPKAAQVVGGVSQQGNVWMRRSYHKFFNDEAISYAFKNSDSPLSQLPNDRLAISKSARAEGKRFWELIRRGDAALSLWA